MCRYFRPHKTAIKLKNARFGGLFHSREKPPLALERGDYGARLPPRQSHRQAFERVKFRNSTPVVSELMAFLTHKEKPRRR
jgi:hypothetical protein